MATAQDIALGRFLEPALWILVALHEGPNSLLGLFDRVRSLDGPVGPATLVGALARLERLTLVRGEVAPSGPRLYRLTEHGRAVHGAAARLWSANG